MSDTLPPDLPPLPRDPQRAPPPGERNGCVTAIMVIVGIILLLPGLCALIFGSMALTQPHFDPGFMPFVVIGLVVGAAGVALIWNAIHRPGR